MLRHEVSHRKKSIKFLSNNSIIVNNQDVALYSHRVKESQTAHIDTVSIEFRIKKIHN
jgi:hypothetical protein